MLVNEKLHCVLHCRGSHLQSIAHFFPLWDSRFQKLGCLSGGQRKPYSSSRSIDVVFDRFIRLLLQFLLAVPLVNDDEVSKSKNVGLYVAQPPFMTGKKCRMTRLNRSPCPHFVSTTSHSILNCMITTSQFRIFFVLKQRSMHLNGSKIFSQRNDLLKPQVSRRHV